MVPEEIAVDEEVFEALQGRAIPFVDTPNSVLRRLLELGPADAADNHENTAQGPAASVGKRSNPRGTRGSRKKKTGNDRSRAPKGALLDEEQYEIPLLETLKELGGRVPTREVLDGLHPKIEKSLTDLDKQPIASGSVRWKNRAQFVRLNLVRKGDMVSHSPRGIWEISEQGVARIGKAG